MLALGGVARAGEEIGTLCLQVELNDRARISVPGGGGQPRQSASQNADDPADENEPAREGKWGWWSVRQGQN